MENCKVYRFNLSSLNSTHGYGSTVDHTWRINMPYTVNKGMVYVEYLFIDNATSAFVGTDGMLAISSNSFPKSYNQAIYQDSNATDQFNMQGLLKVVALNLNKHSLLEPIAAYGGGASDSDFLKEWQITKDAIGYPIHNYSLVNTEININLGTLTFELLTAANVTSFTIGLVIVDFEPEE